VLHQGDRGPAVTMLQQRLRALAYWVPVSGVYDYSTFHAVTALEKVAGLPRNGVMGTAEWAALDSGTRTHPRGSGGVEIDIGHQVLTVVRNGSPLWIFDTSTGRAGFWTPAGHFTIYRQIDAPNVGGTYRPKYYHADLAIHGYDPVPPYPFSHGCARVTDSAMDFIWASGIIPLGTGVYIY
jgi:peptidoglycan hydrolase-like protein with peptidoglycan-binding domain